MSRPLRVAIIGSGPAGVYAADHLIKQSAEAGRTVSIDVLERQPAPYGLVRYGVAPDHPRIKGITTALTKVMNKPEIRFRGNVNYGVDLKLDDLRRYYDAVVFATGSDRDRPLDIPGVDLPGSHGAADFVFWYDGYPEAPRDWTLDAESVAVLGAGNVALDVARVLAKHADDMLPTEIPANVYDGLLRNRATDVHIFGRRGPAQAKFTPLELRELDNIPNVEVVVDPADFDLDEGSLAAIRASNQIKTNVKVMQDWAIRDRRERPRRLFLHFLHQPVSILGEDRVTGLRTERMELDGNGGVTGTGEFHDHAVQAVYRAVGYLGSPLAELPFDESAGTVPHAGGRVLDLDGVPMPGVYASGWIKRGPVGLIGHTKGDALETIENLLADTTTTATEPDPSAVDEFLDQRRVPYTSWDGWQRLDAHELALGEAQGRERVKVVPRDEMTAICHGTTSINSAS